jgi:hypothetical protein
VDLFGGNEKGLKLKKMVSMSILFLKNRGKALHDRFVVASFPGSPKKLDRQAEKTKGLPVGDGRP